MLIKAPITNGCQLGSWLVHCNCGRHWTTCELFFTGDRFDPAVRLAQSAAHFQIEHEYDALEVDFVPKFSKWLLEYWDLASHVKVQFGHDQVHIPTHGGFAGLSGFYPHRKQGRKGKE